MLKLRTEVTIDDCNCNFSSRNTTDYNYINPNGFLTESSNPSLNNYKISDGYFVDTVFRRNYNGTMTLEYASLPRHRISTEVDDDFSVNFPPDLLKGISDGRLTFKSFFIISKDFFDAGLYDPSKVVIYYDPVKEAYQKLVDGEIEHICLSDFMYSFDDTYVGSFSEVTTFSYCNLKNCSNTLILNLLNQMLDQPNKKYCKGVCPDGKLDNLQYRSDFVFAAVNAIKYLLDCNLEHEAIRLLDSLSDCGGFCKNINGVKQINSDCGCS